MAGEGNKREGPDMGLSDSTFQLKECAVIALDEDNFVLAPFIHVDYQGTGPDVAGATLVDASFEENSIRVTARDDNFTFRMAIMLDITYARPEEPPVDSNAGD